MKLFKNILFCFILLGIISTSLSTEVFGENNSNLKNMTTLPATSKFSIELAPGGSPPGWVNQRQEFTFQDTGNGNLKLAYLQPYVNNGLATPIEVTIKNEYTHTIFSKKFPKHHSIEDFFKQLGSITCKYGYGINIKAPEIPGSLRLLGHSFSAWDATFPLDGFEINDKWIVFTKHGFKVLNDKELYFNDGTFKMESYSMRNQVISSSNDNFAWLSNYNNSESQKWVIRWDDDAQAHTIYNRAKKLFLTFENGNVILDKYKDSVGQFWQFEKHPKGHVYIRNCASNVYTLTGYRYNTVKLHMDTSNVNNNYQQFMIDMLQYGTDGIPPVIGVPSNIQIEEGYYKISSKLNNNKVLKNDNNNVVIYDWDESKNEKWRITYDENKNAYKIKSLSSNNYLTFRASDKKIITTSLTNSNEQFWTFGNAGNGNVVIKNLSNQSLVIDIFGSNTSNGIQLIGHEYSGNNNQTFKLDKINPLPNNINIEDGYYKISSKLNNNKVIRDNNNNVVIYDWDNSNNEKWHITYDNNKNAYKIKNTASEKALTLRTSDNKLITTDSSNSDEQYWTFGDEGNKNVVIKNLANQSLVIDIFGSNTSNGIQLIGHEYSSNSNQTFKLDKVKPLPDNISIEDGFYKISTRLDPNKVLKNDNNNVVVYSWNESKNEKWHITYDENKNAYKIKSLSSNNYLTFRASDKKIITTDLSNSDEQYWTFGDEGNENVVIKNLANQSLVIDVAGSNPSNGIPLIAYEYNGNNNQTFKLDKVEHLPNNINIEEGYYKISTRLDPNKVLKNDNNNVVVYYWNESENEKWHITYDENKNAYKIKSLSSNNYLTFRSSDKKIITTDSSNSDEQYWTFGDKGNDNVVIKNLANQSLVIDVAGSNPSNGVPLIAYEYNGNNNQIFKLNKVD